MTQEAPALQVKWSDKFRDFVSKCLTKNPEQRATAAELLEHDFLREAEAHREDFQKFISFWKEKDRLQKQLF